jgi:Ca-activated chloride channel family protein
MRSMERVSGRHRRNFNLKGAGVVGSAMAIVVVISGTWLGYQRLSSNGCSGQIKLTVAAATEIAPAIEQTAQQWVTDGAKVGSTCVAVSVTGINPATMASAIAREHKVSLAGLGAAPASVAVPDVWVPDSYTWLLRLKSEASGFVPTDGKPIAQSPIVVGMPAPVAERALQWPDKKIGWKDLLAQMGKTNSVRVGIVDPTRDAAGLAGLLALGSVASPDVQGQKQAVGALRALAAGASSIREDLMNKFPHSGDPNDLATSLGAAPMSEEDVVAYNREKPPIPLAALYLDPQPPALNYPFAVMPEVDLQKSAAATGLRQALQTTSFKNALAVAGLRAADGTAGSGFAAPIGAPSASAPATSPAGGAEGGGTAAAGIDASVISQAIGKWAAVTVPGRVLAVYDISESMLTKVPTAGGLTRAQVTQKASVQGLSLFDDNWEVGMWVFSTKLVGKRPWRQLVNISPLSSARGELQNSITQIIPKVNGATGLYDTALAAYKEVQEGWEAGRINSVILFTDGQNQNADGITLPSLVSQLTKLKDPKRPVRMVFIGIGDEVNRKELETIANATSAGGVFIAEDPAKISQIFLEAIATRTGAS